MVKATHAIANIVPAWSLAALLRDIYIKFVLLVIQKVAAGLIY